MIFLVRRRVTSSDNPCGYLLKTKQPLLCLIQKITNWATTRVAPMFVSKNNPLNFCFFDKSREKRSMKKKNQGHPSASGSGVYSLISGRFCFSFFIDHGICQRTEFFNSRTPHFPFLQSVHQYSLSK